MSHKHPVYDTDKHFVIDPITKKISTESPKLVLAQHSHNSERFTFEIPKEVEGHDMSLCNLVEIHFQNIEAANKSNKHIDIYKVTDLQTGSGETEDVVFGSWLIEGKATQYVGGLIFAVRFACVEDDGTVEYNWPTLTYSTITVGESIWNSETIANEHPDIIAQFEARIQALEEGGTGGGSVSDEQIAQAVEDYLTENPVEVTGVVKTVNGTAPDENGNVEITIPDSGGNADLTGYATEQFVRDGYQPKGEYLTAVPDGYAKTEDIPTKPEDIGAQPSGNYLTEIPSGYATEEFVKNKIAEAELGGEEVDLSGYAQKSELPTKVSQLENDKGYLTAHQDISGKLDASALPTAINTALAQAKASGEFDGADGVSPTVTVSKSGKVTTITITDANGTKTATINDGEDGKDATATDIVPSYWQSALDESAEAINTALCEAGKNKSAFLFYSDAHWNHGSQMAPTLLKYLYNHTGMTKTFFGGDIVNDEASDYDTMEYLWDWRRQLKDLPNHHSVVGNHDDGNSTNNLFSEQYVYGYLLSAEETPDMVVGDNGLYYYIDTPAEKTRYLCLDTAYKGVDADQTAFITEALKDTPDGWHIVAVSHIWHDVNYDTHIIEALSTDAHALLNLFDNYNARSGIFAECGGRVEFCIGGHTHIDHDSTSTGGIPVILVETDSWHIRSGLDFTIGTTTESSVSAIIADYDAHKIHVVRIGRGESRDVDITNYEVSYTNMIPTGVDIDGVTIYNGKGYKENIRLSGSSGEFRDNTGSCCTGYIKTPVNQAFTVYLKNIVNNTNDNYGCVFNFFSEVHTATTDGVAYANLTNYGYLPVYDDNGNVIQITVPADKAAGYMVVGAVTIDDTSIITINEPIE